jgi:hypothetical protein
MSEIKGMNMLESFSTKLDIPMTSPGGYARMIEVTRATPRVVVCAVGPAGVGKSAIPRQIAKKRNSMYAAIYVPQTAVEDISIPTMAVDTPRYYDKRIPRTFQRLFDYIERVKVENDGIVPDGRQPILAIEEINRAQSKTVTQAMFTLLEDRRIGDTYLDDSIQIVVTMNPSGAAFAVNEFERDPACRRRLSMIGLAPSFGDFIRHAHEAKFHPKLIRHLEAQPTWFYDYEAAMSGKQFPCPASWETVSTILYRLDDMNLPLDGVEAHDLISGKVGVSAAVALVEHLRHNAAVIAPDDVLLKYTASSDVRGQFQKDYLGIGGTESRMDKVDELLLGVSIKLFTDLKVPAKKYNKQLALFMKDLPDEKRKLFIRLLVAESDKGADAKKYFGSLNALLSSEEAFIQAAAGLHQSEDKVKAERSKSGA